MSDEELSFAAPGKLLFTIAPDGTVTLADHLKGKEDAARIVLDVIRMLDTTPRVTP